jgi:hypothetical protein
MLVLFVRIVFCFFNSSSVHGYLIGSHNSSRRRMTSLSSYTFPFPFTSNVLRGNTNKNDTQQKLKAELLQQTIGTQNGLYATESQRRAITSIVQRLEKVNPSVSKISSSTQLNGNWRLIYTTNKGSSAGKIGPWVGQVNQIIDFEGKIYQNVVTVGPSFLLQGSLSATWDVLSNTTWRVKFLDIEFKLFNAIALLKKPLSATGIWRMSYLDDSLRILYASGDGGAGRSANASRENIYILIREE